MKTETIFKYNSIVILNIVPPISKEFIRYKFDNYGLISKICLVHMKNTREKMAFIKFVHHSSMLNALKQRRININGKINSIRQAYTLSEPVSEMYSSFDNFSITIDFPNTTANVQTCDKKFSNTPQNEEDLLHKNVLLESNEPICTPQIEESDCDDVLSLHASSWHDSGSDNDEKEIHKKFCLCEDCKKSRVLLTDDYINKIQLLMRRCRRFRKNNKVGHVLYNKLLLLKKKYVDFHNFFKSF